MKITVFTPTYNRAYTLPKLYESLLRQSNFDFEWMIIDDGSTDDTEDLVKRWQTENNKFQIQYHKTKNGGKPRAINKAIELAKTPYLIIIDSDDYFTDDALSFFYEKIPEIENLRDFVGIGIMQGQKDKTNIENLYFLENHFIDTTNLERKNYGLNIDCNELYKVDILKSFPFFVWEGELFSPEEIVLNEMALQGYKIRWYNKVGVISEYLEDGLTKNSFKLLKENPMGYAMAFNHQLKYMKGFKEKFKSAYLMICYSILGKNPQYLLKSNNLFYTLLAIPVGILVTIRRKMQFGKLR